MTTPPPAQWGARARSLDRARPALAIRRARRADRARRLFRWTYAAGWRACGQAIAKALEDIDGRDCAAIAREIGRHPR